MARAKVPGFNSETPFRVENDTTAGYWHQRPENALPPPDMGAYMRNRPVPGNQVKEELDDITIEQYFSAGFLETNFWYLWRSMFAFENWQSLLEMNLYMHRFLDALDGLKDMSALIFPKYNQYDSFVRPLVEHLKKKGVKVQFGTRAYDLNMAVDGDARTVTAIRANINGKDDIISVGPNDVVFALTGSMTEGTAYGNMETAARASAGTA